MPFTNEVIGTNGVLIRNWMQSANFVTGVSGWQITKAGNAEFNNGTFRGSIQVGVAPNKRFIVNNVATGDVVDIYNNSNKLIFSIDSNGNATSYHANDASTIDGVSSTFGGGQLISNGTNVGQVGDQGSLYFIPHQVGTGASRAGQHFQSNSRNLGITYVADMFAGSDDGTKGPTFESTERGVYGSVVVSDQTSTNNLFHYGEYSVTTDATGTFTFNHNCAFTPTGSLWHVATLGDPIIGYMFSYTNTQATGRAFNGGSGANTVSATFNIHALFVG